MIAGYINNCNQSYYILFHHINFLSCMLQIAKRAEVPGISSESVWDYFVEVLLPAIIRWQARSKAEVNSPMLSDLLHAVANKVEHVSEVIIM